VPGDLLLLLDGPGLVYRSYFAFARNPLVSSSGEQTSVAFGFARALSRIVEAQRPKYWGVAFDTPAPTFRHKQYEKYKANRPSMPDEMVPQLAHVDELLDALRVKRFSVEGYEADDLIGTLATKAAANGLDVILVTEDKDFCQLVSDRIQILNLPKGARAGKTLDRAAVEEKLGVPPEKVIDFLALVGDASDNVPGVRGIGPKTANRLLKHVTNLNDLYANIESVEPPRVRRLLLDQRESAYMSRELVTLDLDAPVGCGLEDLERNDPDEGKLTALLQELEFGRTADGLLSGWMQVFARKSTSRSAGDVVREKVPGPEDPRARVDDSRRSHNERPSMDAASGAAPRRCEDRFSSNTVSLADLDGYLGAGGPGAAWGFSLGPDSAGVMGLAVCGPSQSPAHFSDGGVAGSAGIEGFLSNNRYLKTTFDLKSEGHAASGLGWNIEGVTGDVLLASYLLAPEEKHDIESLAGKYLNDAVPRGGDVTTADVLKWRAQTALRLEGILAPSLAEAGMKDLYRKVEIPLARILMEMEQAGVALNVKALRGLSSRLEKKIARCEEDIYCIAGVTFNINSPQQLSEILFGRLGLPRKRRTKTGYSTNSAVLEELAVEHELPRRVLEYRQLAKLKSTYVDALPRMVDPATGRVHASFHQTVTATGRLSSSNPNLQNIPIRTDLGAQIRKAFVPGDKDWAMLAADYSQIELRIMAHLSGDEALRESFIRGEDAHVATAAAVFGVPLEEVSEELRARAKTVNYGVMYGMGALGLARTLDISRSEAAEFIEDYFAKMPSVKAFLAKLVEKARSEGCASTILNRKRPLPAILSSDRRARAYAERMAINTPIQGSAADIIKKAMVILRERMVKRSMGAKLILQVHDELVFECPRDEMDGLRDIVVDTMESAVELSVPLTVTVGTGDNWWETHR
jgi:DNA polymerase-1